MLTIRLSQSSGSPFVSGDLYPPCRSSQLPLLKTGVAYSQALGLQRICSKSTDYECYVEELKGYLVKRDYNGKLIHQQINKATSKKKRRVINIMGKESWPNNCTSGHLPS